MSDQAPQKKYVGSGKLVGQFGNIAISINVDMLSNSIFEYNGNHYVKLIVGKKKEVDRFGKSHTVWIDDYNPNAGKPVRDEEEVSQERLNNETSVHVEASESSNGINPDDIPF